MRRGVSLQFESIALSAVHRSVGSKTIDGVRGARRAVARVSAVAGVCVLWLAIGIAENTARGQGGNVHAPTEKGGKPAEIGRVDSLKDTENSSPQAGLDAARQELDRELMSGVHGFFSRLEKEFAADRNTRSQKSYRIINEVPTILMGDRADALARELDAARIEANLDAARAAEAELEYKRTLEQERTRAETLMDQLASLRAELDAARAKGAEIAPGETERGALKQERDKAETLARELASARKELEERSARLTAANAEVSRLAAASKAIGTEKEAALAGARDRADRLARELASLQAQADTAKQKQELDSGKERDKAETLARELASARKELEERSARLTAANAEVSRLAAASKAIGTEQGASLASERDRANGLARELASARKELDERSARLAAAYAEVSLLAATNKTIDTEHVALVSERNRADGLARELASIKSELEVRNQQFVALKANRTATSCEPMVENSYLPISTSYSRLNAENARWWELLPGQALASQRSLIPQFPSGATRSTVRESALDTGSKVGAGIDRSTPANSASGWTVDEQRLLARASALLRQADISGARPLLEHALEHGSARAAFMLAETYDVHVLQSWRARGVAGDLVKARALYERAQAGGIEDAKERIKSLK